ncbi:NADH dehydrogenase [ubiquinone] 1 beta subcomplex subunit 2, mitochondrial-like [Cylas formicarius]|uniref:NADH dehydrogenase [ubiquinone] 1 beta subcomplex subunit 2, mitochondrial-like n=1 Tax=Cylas formicarius TaxID=197179 RepID=UPI002958DCB0|nr:NADH dehydrogenase [ubiquinone] 1 beta subcomplex subunit 2, mitochondrial-like [Cylas formicarius]
MLISRGLSTLKAVRGIQNANVYAKQSVRNSGAWTYRKGPPPYSKNMTRLPHLIQAYAIWWIVWHLWTQFDHITGEFPYPDPSKWTDEELGIPPLD